MEVPKKIMVDTGNQPGTNSRAPADYFTDSDDDGDYTPPKVHYEPTTRLMSPPEKLTLPEIGDEERRRYMRDTSVNLEGDSSFKTSTDIDIGLARQVRHLYNRVKLLEEELQAQNTRQMFVFGLMSLYLLSKGFRWMFLHN